jgi:molybdate transport system substrate-binding protein
MWRRYLFIVAILSAVALIGCGNPDPEILCGGSFQLPVRKLVDDYAKETGKKVVLNFGQSEDHLPKVKTKAGGDLFVSHTPYMRDTKDADALTRYVSVGYMAPVIVVPKGNERNIQGIGDLAGEGIKVAVSHPEFSTCGEMLVKLLEEKGIKDEVMENVGGAQFRSHADVATHVKLGKCDVGVMWNGVAHNFCDDLDVIRITDKFPMEIEVGVMGLSYSKKPKEVEAFLKYVDEHGKDVFTEFGYVK